ncbi:hypothetical protein J3R30DRAFT_3403286 [Lentinula aciculospora]|uniref:Uncharacterized protein n=1 Tax=Lentinula aciculospora TaxID=153920 RepID=A0A9W9AFT5_9AGAR|nr:hypothetical protein J3R30DRAFT_3403286 [Lentinula aciculospora]
MSPPPPPPPPPPPLFPIFITPHAKESFPLVQSAHEHLRNASDTIHQHRNSLASQLRVFDSRWAHLFSVAPVLNKLTKGRQRPQEFHKNAENLDVDVQVALGEARQRKYSQARVADEQDSVVPGPPPSDTVFSRVSRKMRTLSSIVERVQRGDQVQPGTSRSSRSPQIAASQWKHSKNQAGSSTKSPPEKWKEKPSKLTINATSDRRPTRVKKKDSRHSMRSVRSIRSMRSASPFRPPKSKHSSRDRYKTTTGERDRERDRDYRDTEGRARDRERNRDREWDRDRERDRERERDGREWDRDRDRERDREQDRKSRERDRERDTHYEHTQRHIRRSPQSPSRRTHHRHRHRHATSSPSYSKSPEKSGHQPSAAAPPPPIIPSNLPPIYARFANGHLYQDGVALEPLEPPVLPFVTERMEKRRRDAGERYDGSTQYQTQYPNQEHEYHRDNHGRPPPSSYPLPVSSYPYNAQHLSSPDRRGRKKDTAEVRDQPGEYGHRRTGYNGYNGHDNYTYSSTSTPVIPIMSTLPNSNSSVPINTNVVIPAPSSNRHLSRSRYPPPRSRADRSPYLHLQEDYRYKTSHSGRNGGYNGYNGYDGSGRDGLAGVEYQGDSGYEFSSNPRHAQTSPASRTPYPPKPTTKSPRSPLIMRSKFKENFSIPQSESNR